MAEAPSSAGDGPSYIALLRWFWTFAGLDGVPIGGSALNDGRHYLRALSILAPQVTAGVGGYVAACESGDTERNFALLERVLAPSGIHAREGLVQDLQARRFHAVHEFLRLLHHRSITSDAKASPVLAHDAPEDDLLDSCFARGVLWLLQLVADWPRAPPDAEAAALHASTKNLHAQLTGRTLTAAFVDGAAVRARLCSGELYALASALVFSVPLVELHRRTAAETHARVLDFLADQGYHVLDADGDQCHAVQQLASGCGSGDDARWVHMSVLWRTMEAYTHSVLDLSAVMAHSMALVSQMQPVDGSQGFVEAGEALQSWMAAVCKKFDRALASVQQKHGKAAHEIQRAMPDVTDLVAAFSDGVCVPGLWSFYLPKLLPFSSLKIKEPLHDSHRIGNWKLVQSLAPQALGGLMSFNASGRMNLDAELDRPWVVALMSSWFAEWVGARAFLASPSPRKPDQLPPAGFPSSPSKTPQPGWPSELVSSPSRLPAARRSALHQAWEDDTADSSKGEEVVEEEEAQPAKELPPSGASDGAALDAAAAATTPAMANTNRGKTTQENVTAGDARGKQNVLAVAPERHNETGVDASQQAQPRYGLYYDEEKKCWLSVDFDSTVGSNAAAAFAAASTDQGMPDIAERVMSTSLHSSAELRASSGSHVSTGSNRSRGHSGSIELPPPELGETGSSAKIYADDLDRDAENETELGAELAAGSDDFPRTAFVSRPHPSRSSQPGGFDYASKHDHVGPERHSGMESAARSHHNLRGIGRTPPPKAHRGSGGSTGGGAATVLGSDVVVTAQASEGSGLGGSTMMEARVLRLERERNMLKLEMDRQRLQFEEERQAWESQRQRLGADIMNEVYEKLRQDVSDGGPANANEDPHLQSEPSNSIGRSGQSELGQTVGSQASELRVSFGSVSTTDDSINGSYDKPRSALPWQVEQPIESQGTDSPRRAGLPSPPRQLGNPLTRMLGPEPEPEPEVEPEPDPEHIVEQLRQSREQLARIQQQQHVEESQLDLDSTAGSLSLANGRGAKKDAAFKAKLRADNARLQAEIERLRSQLYAEPTGAGPDNGLGTPTGMPGDPTVYKTDSQQVQDLAGGGEVGDTPTDMWLAGAESPTDAEKVARQKKLDEFKRRKDAEAARRKEKHAERRKSQEIAALAAQQQAEVTTAALNQLTHGEAATPGEELDVVFGSHVSADGKIVPPARLHPGIEKRRAARAAAKQASAGGGLQRETLPASPELVADPLAVGGGGWANTAWKEHVVSHRSNQQLIKNALHFVCLAGPVRLSETLLVIDYARLPTAVRAEERQLVLDLLKRYEGYKIIILLNVHLKFRGLYVCNHDGSGSQRIYGTGPTSLSDSMVEHTYKYDSGSKEFKQLPTVRIGNTCDAVSLKAKFYKQARPDMYVQPVASAF